MVGNDGDKKVKRKHKGFTCDHDHNEHQRHNEKHDAYYCSACDVWIETGCDDPTCDYCPTRPEKPSMVTK